MQYSEFRTGRCFMGRLAHQKDLLKEITEFCRSQSIQTAYFSVIGAVSSATLGAYDQKQQVYISYQKKGYLEIVSCTGNVSMKEGHPFVHAHAILTDEEGNAVGGHVFNETIVFAGEIYLRELVGEPLERMYDETTGLMLWKK